MYFLEWLESLSLDRLHASRYYNRKFARTYHYSRGTWTIFKPDDAKLRPIKRWRTIHGPLFDSSSFIPSPSDLVAFLKQIYPCRADATCDGNEEISFHESIRGVKRSPRRGRRLSNVADAVSIIPSNVAAWICASNEKHRDFAMRYSIRQCATSRVLDQTWMREATYSYRVILQHYRTLCNIIYLNSI